MAPGSDCRSPRASSRRTAAEFGSKAPWAAARPSPLPFRSRLTRRQPSAPEPCGMHRAMPASMTVQAWFDQLPLWLLFLLTLGLVALAIEIGVRFGRRERRHAAHEGESQVGLATTSVLGLVAFIVG